MEPLVPDELLKPLVAFYNPQKVILFGSRARGDAGPDSDIDLFVVLDDDVPLDMLGWRAINDSRRTFHRATDIVPCRAAVFAEEKAVVGTLAHTAAEEGKVVYERPRS